jgi:hypothetical protein
MFRSQNDKIFDRDDEFTEGDVQFRRRRCG